MRKSSILRRAMAAVLLIECLAAVLLLVVTAAYERHTRYRAFDDRLEGRAAALLGAVGDADDPADNVLLDTQGLQLPRNDFWEVSEGNGRLLGRSEEWPPPESPLGKALATLATTGGRLSTEGARFVVLHGTRVVDPGEGGGGKPHPIVVVYGASTRHLRGEVLEAMRFYALAFAGVLLLTAVLLAGLLRRALLPLGQLAAAAGGISPKNWSFDPPPSASATEELAPLTAAILTSVERLQELFERQQRFTSDAAHELKTDVAIVKSSLQLLTLRPRSPEEYAQGLAVSVRDCDRMEETVQQMLALARASHGDRGEDARRPADLLAHAAEAVRALLPMAELRGVLLEMEGAGPVFAPASVSVFISGRNCDLLCLNLLENAVQYSTNGGRVRARVGLENDGALLEVLDEGEGIAPDALPHLFEPFYRADDARDRKRGGAGLGLAICKAICERAGGTIQVESRPGDGTRVTVRLPAVACSVVPST